MESQIYPFTCLMVLLQNVLRGLRDKGHEVLEVTGVLAVVQNILNRCPSQADTLIQDKCIFASSDGAKGGKPDGY